MTNEATYPNFPTHDFIHRLRIHMSCAQTAIDDMLDLSPCYVCFDHSLLAPWLYPLSPKDPFRIIGFNIFRFYQKYGAISPYKLTVNYPTLRETQDQLVHACERFESFSMSLNGINTPHFVHGGEMKELLEKFEGHLSRESIHMQHFQNFYQLVSEGKIIGTRDPFSGVGFKEMYSKEDINEYRELLLASRQYTQPDLADRMMHIECDAIRPPDVLYINREFNNAKYVYSGGATISLLFGSARDRFSRHPLSILSCLYALAIFEGSENQRQDAIKWLTEKKNAIQKCLDMIYSKGVGDYSELKIIDRQKVDVIEAIYIIPLYERSDSVNAQAASRSMIMSQVLTPKELKEKADEALESTREAASDFSRSISNEDDEDVYSAIEEKLSPESRERIERIVQRIQGPKV